VEIVKGWKSEIADEKITLSLCHILLTVTDRPHQLKDPGLPLVHHPLFHKRGENPQVNPSSELSDRPQCARTPTTSASGRDRQKIPKAIPAGGIQIGRADSSADVVQSSRRDVDLPAQILDV
jgi:hypothetical protein